MTQSNWHTLREGARTTVARHLPVRFDVSASAEFPDGNAARLAHMIRQDMWRALQNLRGFSPVVQVEKSEGTMKVTAGGRVLGLVTSGLEGRIGALLNDAGLRRRWIACAAKGQS
ncbi:hypothetical protein [Planktotalea sp.]|uniref:hypothetical protein n=1 Tax=Planktotalea sp. TaxID=2029877 RepID=UPI003D6C2874